MDCTEKGCKKTLDRKIKKKTSAYPILAGILIAILPKCPFCIAAYSSAIALCSGKKIYNQSPDWTNFISISLAVLTLLMILMNYRGKRTWFAVALVFIGSLLIIRTELYTGELIEYYYGAGALLFGVWVNGSFYFFYQRWIRPLLEYALILKKEEV